MDTVTLPDGAIVVGVDGSSDSDRAVSWAADEAALTHAPIVLVHAIGILGRPGTPQLEEAQPEVREPSDELLAAAAQRVSAGHPTVEIHTHALIGHPRIVLLQLGNAARLVVVGSRGRGPVGSHLLGSVSAAVARHCSCPVVVVRPHHPGRVRRGVLVGVDATAAAIPTLEVAYREASLRRLPLTVMHCVADAEVDAESDGPDLTGGRLLLAEAVAGFGEKYPDVPVRRELPRDVVEHALWKSSDDMHLLVMGRHHHDALSWLLTGNVAGYLVEHASTTVIVVPVAAGSTSSRESA